MEPFPIILCFPVLKKSPKRFHPDVLLFNADDFFFIEETSMNDKYICDGLISMKIHVKKKTTKLSHTRERISVIYFIISNLRYDEITVRILSALLFAG